MAKKTDNFLINGLTTKGRYIPDLEKLDEVIKALRVIGAKIVLTQGTFDFIHVGHFLYLEKAKSHGDILIVGVDNDEKVRKRKGADRPIVSDNERVQMLTHVRHVDLVTLKTLEMPHWTLMKLVKPDTLVVTKETYTDKEIKQLLRICGNVVILEPQATTSTSAKIRRLNIGLSQKIKESITESINQTFDKLINES
jgi:rfaE bifunctional protein nucleotidyltransferase chain/domain